MPITTCSATTPGSRPSWRESRSPAVPRQGGGGEAGAAVSLPRRGTALGLRHQGRETGIVVDRAQLRFVPQVHSVLDREPVIERLVEQAKRLIRLAAPRGEQPQVVGAQRRVRMVGADHAWL